MDKVSLFERSILSPQILTEYLTLPTKIFSAGAGYHVLAGKEVARALALMSLKPEDCTSDLTGLTEKQLQTLKQWEERYHRQYPVVGKLVEGNADMKDHSVSGSEKLVSHHHHTLSALFNTGGGSWDYTEVAV